MKEYNPHEIEPRWQKVWAETGAHKATEDTSKPKRYVLEMFPYPSGDIHMGHVRNYTIGDVTARYYAMRGYDVLHPMGWDAFGLPAENAAIKHNSHPAKWTYANIETQKASFKRMGFSYDWDRTVVACDPEYYRWGQWIFEKFWERGLVERRNSPVNWCPGCQTVLANEQVIEGRCWRCDSEIEKRDLTQWYLKITDYAQELLDDLSDEDVLSLSGVTQTVWMQEPVKKPLSGQAIQFWRAALLTPGDDGPDRWAILTYFQYEDGEDWSGDTDGLWLVPHYPYDAYVEEALSGYILYDGPEGTMAAPMQSLVRQEQGQYTDWLWPDIPSSVGLYLFAEWSLPRKGENIRGYLLYWRETVPPMEGDAVHMMDQPYLHRQMKWRYPYATALDQRSIPYATQNFEPGLFSVYQQADGTVSAYLDSAERGSISKRGTPPIP